MENVLNNFRDRLENTTNQIKHLHRQSEVMSVRLKNRTCVETSLGRFLKIVAVDPARIGTICDGPIDESFLEAFRDIMHRTRRFAESRTRAIENHRVAIPSDPLSSSDEDEDTVRLNEEDIERLAWSVDTMAVRDVIPEIERLRRKAVARVRLYLLETISTLRRPNTNVQMIQQNKLRGFSDFVTFLRICAPARTAEVERVYVMTMSQVFLDLFRSYHVGLLQLRIKMSDDADVIARSRATSSSTSATTTSIGVLEMLTGSNKTPSASDANRKRAKEYTVMERLNILQRLDDPPIIVHVAEGMSERFPYEALFRSVQRHLMSLATFEYRFVGEFFCADAEERDKQEINDENDVDEKIVREDGEQKRNHDENASTPPSNGNDDRKESLEARAANETRTRVDASGAESVVVEKKHIATRTPDEASEVETRATAATRAPVKPPRRKKMSRQNRLFRMIFERTLAECTEQLEHALLDHYDALGLLLMIRIARANAMSMKRRRIRTLDGYFKNILSKLWRRFSIVIDRHCASLQSVAISDVSVTSTTEMSTTLEPQAHYTARRFADLCSSIVLVGEELDDADLSSGEEISTFDRSVTMLTTSIQKLLMHLAMRAFRDDQRKCAVFFINNFNQMIPFFQERVPHSSVLRDFEHKCALQVDSFVDLELSAYFHDLVSFVKTAQSKQSDKGEPFYRSVDDVVRTLKSFAATWKKALKSIDRDIIQFFSDFKRGVEISRKVLTRLLLYYTRFLEIADKMHAAHRVRFVSEKVDVQSVVHEVKKYNRSFD